MPKAVKTPRSYASPLRESQAAATRQQVLDAARRLFTTQGYAATTVGQVAADAGVSVDTLYATIGRKPMILRAVVESAISGTDHAIPAAEREYVQRVRAAPDARTKIRIYADAVAAMSPRTAPAFAALRDATRTDPDCAALDAEISERRAGNMLLMAADLRGTGELRPDLTDAYIADVIWATAGWEHYLQLFSGRGWTPTQYADHLAELWCRLFLAEP